MRNKYLPYSLVLAAVLALSCEKGNDAGAMLKVKLTDAPYNAEAVNVEIQGIKVRFQGQEGSTDGKDWVWLNTRAGVYNLLALQNGVTTNLADGGIPTGKVKEIRLVLGQQNTVKVGGKTLPLLLPPNDGSGYKILINRRLSGTLDSLTIDFDAGQSIMQLANGDFKLTPVLKVLE